MKLYPRTLSFASVTLLGILIAACSSKSSDNGDGTDNTGAGGVVATGQGGSANGNSQTTGGKAAATGGKPSTSTSAGVGGATSLPQLPTACPGIAITTSAVDAGTVTNPDAGTQCAGVGIELEPSPLDIYMMMDRTESMTYPIQNTTLERWDVLQQGVQQFVNDPSVQTKAPRVGLGFFGKTGNPNDPTECLPVSYATPQIEIASIATNGPLILQAVIDERALLGGQTPWFPALQGSLMHAQDWQTANPTRLTVVVLVTDGYPTECDTDMSDIQEMVGEYYAGISGQYNTRGQPGIRTYIIGVAVDKFNLDAVAQSGGTGSATIVDSSGAVDQFVSAMVNITNANINCDIPLPSPPSGQVFDPTQVQVVYKPFQGTNQEIPMASSAGGCGAASGGWYFDNPASPTKISLCPCSCANLGAGGIEIRFGCRPQTVIN